MTAGIESKGCDELWSQLLHLCAVWLVGMARHNKHQHISTQIKTMRAHILLPFVQRYQVPRSKGPSFLLCTYKDSSSNEPSNSMIILEASCYKTFLQFLHITKQSISFIKANTPPPSQIDFIQPIQIDLLRI